MRNMFLALLGAWCLLATSATAELDARIIVSNDIIGPCVEPHWMFGCPRETFGCADAFEEFDVFIVIRDLTQNYRGFQFGYRIVLEAELEPIPIRVREEIFASNYVNVGNSSDILSGTYAVIWSIPRPPTSPETVLVRWTFKLLSSGSIMRFLLAPYCCGPAALQLEGGGPLVPIDVSAYAGVNGFMLDPHLPTSGWSCPEDVVNEVSSFGVIKALFR